MAQPPPYSSTNPGSPAGGGLFGGKTTSPPALVFGGAAGRDAVTGFGFESVGQSASSGTFGNLSGLTPTGFGMFGAMSNPKDSSGSGKSVGFGSSAEGSGTLFGKQASFEAPLFGGQTTQSGPKPETSTLFRSQPLFGKAAKVSSPPPQTSLFGTLATSSNTLGTSVFGSARSSPSKTSTTNSSGFGSRVVSTADESKAVQQPGLFGRIATSRTGFGSGVLNVSPSSTSAESSSGFGSRLTSSAADGSKATQHSVNPFASAISTLSPTSSANLFAPNPSLFIGSSSATNTSLGVNQGGLADSADGGFRERSSSGTMGSSMLFGKKQAARGVALPSPATSVGPAASSTNPFISGSQDMYSKPISERSLFGKDSTTAALTSVSSKTEGLFGSKPGPLFSRGSQGSQPTQSGFLQSEKAVSLKSGASMSPEMPAHSTSSAGLFGKPGSTMGSGMVDGNLIAVSTAPSAPQLFGKVNPSQNTLFGKTSEGNESNLFGKTSEGNESTLSGEARKGREQGLLGKTREGREQGLFGKASKGNEQTMSEKTSEGSEQTMPGKTREGREQGLFGKTNEGKEQTLFGKTQYVQTVNSSGARIFGAGFEEQTPFEGGKAPESLSHSPTSSDFQQLEKERGQEARGDMRLGTEAYQKSQAGSPSRRSLSKWNRARDPSSNLDKKRPGGIVDSRETKRTRGDDDEDKKAPRISAPRFGTRSPRQQSVDDQSLKTSIIIRDIPVHLNKGGILRDHFSRFGTIKRLQSMPTKNAANITFSSHVEAKAAKDKGKQLGKGPPLAIFWRNVAKPPAASSPESRLRRGKDDKPSRSAMGGQVQDELASMAGTFDNQEEIFPESSRALVARTAHKAEPQPERKAAEKRSPTPPRRLSPTPPPCRQEEDEVRVSEMPDIEIAKKLLKIMVRTKPKDVTEITAVLDAKDKLHRMVLQRKSNLASAQAFVGTCQDMCPEKERYYREDIRRLALYEVIPSTLTSLTGLKSKVDHARAVKEYSRSSADQEEPLPYELRPLPVLMTTMNYLLSEVADQGGEGKWSEWYDFLWNRTRGIRKDITQQQLCEVEVAELLEKCTRFHIFCSARLCEEDMMSFDAKINNENLTKCLQTLKELYADLDKRQVYCPNEAEFRAYMVLMNLNEGDTLREVQQLRPEIRESASIGFALKAYNALNSSNYVRFFRLIRDATFLNACVLHRYFNQIRGQALHIIMKAHRATGKNKILYPVRELMRLLKFEDSVQVELFCDHYCLTVEGEEIVMDAQAFLEPEGSIPETRAQTLVEAKRTVTVGETINGCPLPPLQLPTPTSSFDETGTFILPANIQEWLAKGMTGMRSVPPPQTHMLALEEAQAAQPELSAPSQMAGLPNALDVQRGRAMYSNEAIKSIVRTLILEEIDAEMQSVARSSLEEEQHEESLIMTEVEDISQGTVQHLARDIAEEVIEEEESSMRQRLAQEMAAQRQRVFTSLCDGLIEEMVSEMTSEMAKEEMTIVHAELHRQQIERCSLAVQEEMLTSTVDGLILDVAQEVFDVDVLAKRERLAATEACVLEMRCRRYFQTWRRKYLAQIRVKRAMLDFPSTAPNVALGEQVEQLVSDRPNKRLVDKAFYVGNRAKLTIQSPMEVIQQQLFLSTHLSMASARRMLASLVQLRPLDLSHTVAPLLYRVYAAWLEDGLIEPDTTPLQWKVSVSFPRQQKCTLELESNFFRWMRAKLCRDAAREAILAGSPTFEGEVLSLYHLNADSNKSGHAPLGVCIRLFHGAWTDNQEITALNKSLLKGTSALIFVCSNAEDLNCADASSKTSEWKENRRRLHQMLRQKPKTPRIPVVLVVPRLTGEGTLSLSELQEGLELQQLHKAGLVSAVHVAQVYIGSQAHPVEFISDWTTQLSTCLRFAASHVPTPPKLRVKPVSSYVEDSVVEMYKASVYQDLRTRTRLQMVHQSPNSLVSLYNEVIEHLALTCASDSLVRESWPAPEFDKSRLARQEVHLPSEWNSETHLCNLYELVASLRLPYFRYSDLEAPDWATACRDVWAYLATVTKKDSGSAKICLYRQAAQLLKSTRKKFDQFCWLASEDGPCEPTYTNMAWTDIVDACIHYKLLSLRSGLLDIRKPEADDDEEQVERVEDFVETQVFYMEEELEDWEPPASWVDALRDTETAEHGQLKPAVRVAATKRDQTLLEKSAAREAASKKSGTQPECAPANLPATQISVCEQTEDTDEAWASLQHKLKQERAATDSFLSQLSAAVSAVDESPATDLPSPCNFDAACFSPIKAPGSTRNSQGQGLSRNATVFTDTTKVVPGFTPCRPKAKSGKPFMWNSPSDQGAAAFGAGADIRGGVDHNKVHGASGPNGAFSSGGGDYLRPGLKISDKSGRELEEEDMTWAESSMSEKVASVRDRAASQREEDKLFEMKLRRMLDAFLFCYDG